ncbi:MFS transporter [Bradyrhizobium forestalis]|uniref:MFS transporter n=1 Tax=Bradyrhizobium forestalis TaxID=1419263 RepID=A0A2M8R2I8_9BRAD|nr:MFS transporter [Bradyrhizobium forestalis]PJG52033.1 MFS transporter [Bradyrhizobium forestalis]
MPSIETPYSWIRLSASITLSTLGCVGMWSLVVALPAVQADFNAPRAEATLPYTLAIIGFMIGGIIVGRLADRFGILPPLAGGTILMSLGYVLTAFAPNLSVFAMICGLTIGLGGAASFAPLVADTSLWFDRHRGLAVSLATAGSSLAGVVWPPIVQHAIAAIGWRQTHIGIGLLCLATMLPLSLVLLRRPIFQKATPAAASPGGTMQAIGLSPGATQGLLALAGMCCCVAMSMPQVHLVAYCGDLGYGAARGAEMLAVMLGFSVASRLIFGWLLNLIGGLPTLLLGSAMQATALALYLPFNGLASLYVVSAVFGLAQGGIVPSYAVIIRELFPAQEAGFRVSLAISVTLAGMALGGWMAGAIYDWTGSYASALINGIAWNIANMAIAAWLLERQRRRAVGVCAASAALS